MSTVIVKYVGPKPIGDIFKTKSVAEMWLFFIWRMFMVTPPASLNIGSKKKLH